MSSSIEVDYLSRPVLYSQPKFHKIVSNETNGTVTVDNSGGQSMTFNLPANEAYNLGKSYLKFPYAVDAGTAGSYQYMPADCHPWWSIIDMSPTSGIPMMHVEDYDHYSKLVMRPSVHYDDFKTFDSVRGFSKCNTLVSQNKLSSGANTDVNWDEPKMWTISALATALSGTLYIPFETFIDTALSVNKVIYPGQIVTLQFTFKPTTQFLFVSTDPYNPSIGAAAINSARTFTVTSPLLYLAVEKNQFIVDDLKKQYLAGTHSFTIPYVKKVNKTSFTGASDSVIVRFYPKDGKKLVKIYQGMFNATEWSTIANFLNTTLPATGTGNTFYTDIDSLRRQENDLVIGQDDYLWLRERFKGSCYLSKQSYINNWVWIECFDEDIPKSEQDLPLENRDVGLDLSMERIWSFNVTWSGNQTLNFYTYPITLKTFRASPAGIEIFP